MVRRIVWIGETGAKSGSDREALRAALAAAAAAAI